MSIEEKNKIGCWGNDSRECPYIVASSMATQCTHCGSCPEEEALSDLLVQYEKTKEPLTEEMIEQRVCEVFGGPEKQKALAADLKNRITEAIKSVGVPVQ